MCDTIFKDIAWHFHGGFGIDFFFSVFDILIKRKGERNRPVVDFFFFKKEGSEGHLVQTLQIS